MFFAAPLAAQLPGGGGSGSPIVDLKQGIGFLQKEQFVRAKKHFERLSASDPQNELPSYYLALACAGLGERDGALQALEEATARGWRDPESWRNDPGLAALSADPLFQTGLEEVISRVLDRRDQGVIDRIDFSDLRFVDDFDIEQTLSEGAERPTALLFVRGTGEDLSSIWIVREWLEAVGEQARLRVLVECRGKRHVDRLAALERFRDELRLDVPLGIATKSQRQRLRPWLDFPTLVLLDGKSQARGVVDGFPADLEVRYEQLLARALHLDEEDENTAKEDRSDAETEGQKKPPQKAPSTRPKKREAGQDRR